MEKHPINDLMAVTMEKMREMVDANAIVGQPITTPDGVTLIPVSRMSFGFGSGGGDYNTKYTAGTGTGANFAGGSGAGVDIAPIAFLVVKDGFVRVLPVRLFLRRRDRLSSHRQSSYLLCVYRNCLPADW